MKKSFILLLLALFPLAGCEKELLEITPDGQQTVDDLFATADGANAAINAAYEQLGLMSAGEHAILQRIEEKSDNAFHGREAITWSNYTENSTTLGLADTWSAFYTGIQRCNTVLNRIGNVPFTTAAKNSKLPESIEGQALFLRALNYFWLVQIWGDVPLHTQEIIKPDEALKARASTKEIYDQIKADLALAIQKLPLKTALTGGKGFEKFRASKGAANALKAEVHLVLGEWQQAADAANGAIASNEFSLYPSADYIKNFQGRDENGIESVFEIQFTDNLLGRGSIANTWFGLAGLVQGNGRHGSPATDNTQTLTSSPGIRGDGLVQAFEQNDLRMSVAISTYNNAKNPIDATKPSLWNCNKYFVGTATPSENRSYANIPLIRYAKVLLTRAEALNELGAGNTEAVALVNQIRARAGLAALATTVTGNQESLRRAIWQERRVELCFESQRYFDLLRTGQLFEQIENKQKIPITRARIVKHPINGKDIYLLPIPQTEINNNPQMKQNPGY